MFESQLHPSPCRKPAHFAISVAAHVTLLLGISLLRVDAPAPAPPAPTPRQAMHVTLKAPPRPPKTSPRIRPRPAAAPPVERARVTAPPPRTPQPETAIAAPEAPRIESAPAQAVSVPRPEPAPPALPEAPRPAVRTEPVFGNVKAEAPPRDANIEASGKPMFSATKAQAAAMNVAGGRTASAGFGSARVGESEAKSANKAAEVSGFGGVSARSGQGSGPAAAQTAQAGFGSVQARQFEAAPAAPKAAEKPEVQPVRILAKPDPVYTAEARALRLEGDVAVEALFTADGRVVEIRVLRGLGHGLDEAAVAAVRAIEFEPARRAGVAEDARLRLTVRFQIAY